MPISSKLCVWRLSRSSSIEHSDLSKDIFKTYGIVIDEFANSATAEGFGLLIFGCQSRTVLWRAREC